MASLNVTVIMRPVWEMKKIGRARCACCRRGLGARGLAIYFTVGGHRWKKSLALCSRCGRQFEEIPEGLTPF